MDTGGYYPSSIFPRIPFASFALLSPSASAHRRRGRDYFAVKNEDPHGGVTSGAMPPDPRLSGQLFTPLASSPPHLLARLPDHLWRQLIESAVQIGDASGARRDSRSKASRQFSRRCFCFIYLFFFFVFISRSDKITPLSKPTLLQFLE